MHLTKLSDKKFTALSGVEYDVGVGQDLLKEHSLYIGSRVETVRGIGIIVGLVDSDIYVYKNDTESQSDINTAKLYQSEKISNNDMTNNNANNKICIEVIPFSLTDLGTHVIRAADTNFTLIDSNTECSAQDNSIKENATESHKNITASSPVNDNVTHRVKKIVLHGRCVTIVTQEKEGPCPVIALANALALQGEISLSSYTYRIAATELRSVIASYLWSREHQPPRFVFKGVNRETENRKNCYENNSSFYNNNKNEEYKKLHPTQNDDEENSLDVNHSKDQREKEQTMLREAVQDANSFITIRRKLIGEHVHTSIAETTLEKLYTGLIIDPIFSDVEAFALNDDEVALFALAGIRLVHGWVMSPSMESNSDFSKYYCYNNSSNNVYSNNANCYCNNSSTISLNNAELSNCKEYSSTNYISDTNTIESITNELRHLSFNELTTFLASTSSESNTSRTTSLTSRSIKSTFSSVSGRMRNTFDKYYTNASTCEDASYTDEDSDNKKTNIKSDSGTFHCNVDHITMLTRYKLANEFYQSTYVTQMTQYGASMLSDAISENEVVVLYWRWHFFTLINMHGRLLTLCSNENFVDKPSFVFSVLDTKLLEENGFADGDGNDVNSVLSYVQANVGNMFTEKEIHAAHAEIIKQHFQSETCLSEKESDSAAVKADAEPCVDPAKVLEYLQAKRKTGIDNKSNTALMQTNKYTLHDIGHNNASNAESSSSLTITSSQTTNVSDSTIYGSSICNTRESDGKNNITNAKSGPVGLIAPSETWFNVDKLRSKTLTDNLESTNTNMFDTCHNTLTNEEKINGVALELMEMFPYISRDEALEFVQNNNNNLAAAADAYCRKCF